MPATPLQSGHIQNGNNTPTGATKQIAVDNPYITKDDFVSSFEAQGINITSSNAAYSNGVLDAALLRASAWVNRYCRMYFDTQTIDETKTAFTVRPYNPQLVTVVVANRPYNRINSCYIQVLKWFIEVDVTSPASYIQDFPDYGYFKIVPLLSSSGQGAGSPIPSNIIDRIALGVLWYNYTFGYGTPLTAQTIHEVSPATAHTSYQAFQGNRLWAPSQTFNVYKNGVLVAPALYTVDYPNGIIIFTTPLLGTDVVTADFTTNESIPADIKEATILLAAHLIGQALQNGLGADSYSIQTYSIRFGDKSKVQERVEQLLAPYRNANPVVI